MTSKTQRCTILSNETPRVLNMCPNGWAFTEYASPVFTFTNKKGRNYVASVYADTVSWAFGEPNGKLDALEFALKKYKLDFKGCNKFLISYQDMSSCAKLAPKAYEAFVSGAADKEATQQLNAVLDFVRALVFAQEALYKHVSQQEPTNPFKIINFALGRHPTFGTKNFKPDLASRGKQSMLERKIDLLLDDEPKVADEKPIAELKKGKSNLQEFVDLGLKAGQIVVGTCDSADADLECLGGADSTYNFKSCSLDQPGDLIVQPYFGKHPIEFAEGKFSVYLVNLDGKAQPKVDKLVKFVVIPPSQEKEWNESHPEWDSRLEH